MGLVCELLHDLIFKSVKYVPKKTENVAIFINIVFRPWLFCLMILCVYKLVIQSASLYKEKLFLLLVGQTRCSVRRT